MFSNPTRYLSQYFFSLRFEGSYRHANVPYYAGPGGTTSPSGYQPTPVDDVPDVVKDQVLFVVAPNFRL